MKKKTKRCTFRALSAVFALLLPAMLLAPASAAAPDVAVDESVYINLDYYGEVTDTSIVKGCDLNGNQTFTDHGSYDSVTNMTNYVEPILTADGVQWEFEEATGRFYYECKPKKKKDLMPWSIDVSYSLNGTPVKAETLAGASGLVQVDIDVTPNEDIPDYYKNNMMLMAATLVNLEDVYSFRADGAQMQTVGSQKTAIFMALPGEERSFSYQIGSNSFESIGTIFFVMPVTMSQMDEIQDIKDAKERIEDAADAMNATLNILLDSMGSISGGLRQTQEGLRMLDEARQKIYDARTGMETQNKKLASSMSGLSATLRRLAQKIDDSEDDLDNFSHHFETLTDGMSGAQQDLRYINKNLSDIKKFLGIMETSTDPSEVAGATKKVYELSQTLTRNMQKLQEKGFADGMENEAAEMKKALEAALSSAGTADQAQAAQEAQAVIGEMLSELRLINANVKTLSSAGGELSAELADAVNSLVDTNISSSLVRVLSSTGYLMDNLHNFDLYIQETIDDCEDILNDGIAATISGLDNTLESAANSLDRTGEIRQQKDIIKQTINDEWDRLEDDLGILNIDVNAKRPSFTSDKNPAPSSIQIVMRTQEISIPDEMKGTDMETAELPESVWERIAQIFLKIWNALLSLFQ